MKIRLFLLSALLGSSTVYGATIIPPSDLQKGLEIYMDFDSPNKNEYDSYGSYTGGIAWGNGNSSTGAGFGGSGAYNETGKGPGTAALSAANISTQNFTINFQFKDWQLLGGQVALWMKTSTGQKIDLLRTDLNFNMAISGGTGARTETIMAEGPLWSLGSWNSFTMTSSSTGIEFYLNGESIKSSTAILNAGFLSEFQLAIGWGPNATPAAFKTDDFGLWNRVLTAEEIQFLSTNTASTKMPSAAVPEPGTASLALLGLSGFLIRRRRSRNS